MLVQQFCNRVVIIINELANLLNTLYLFIIEQLFLIMDEYVNGNQKGLSLFVVAMF